jgi:hypothetical protein
MIYGGDNTVWSHPICLRSQKRTATSASQRACPGAGAGLCLFHLIAEWEDEYMPKWGWRSGRCRSNAVEEAVSMNTIVYMICPFDEVDMSN